MLVVFVTSHTLAGALIGASLRRHPVAAFGVGVVSHLAMDAVPHWGCAPGPGARTKFLRAAVCDGCLGLGAMAAVAVTAPSGLTIPMLAGMAGAAFPDLNKPSLLFFGAKPFPAWWEAVHSGVQRHSPGALPRELAIGAVGALAVALTVAALRRPARRSSDLVGPALTPAEDGGVSVVPRGAHTAPSGSRWRRSHAQYGPVAPQCPRCTPGVRRDGSSHTLGWA